MGELKLVVFQVVGRAWNVAVDYVLFWVVEISRTIAVEIYANVSIRGDINVYSMALDGNENSCKSTEDESRGFHDACEYSKGPIEKRI